MTSYLGSLSLRTAISSALAFTMICGLAVASESEIGPSGLVEVVVTAQKRQENINDVPMSISAFDEATLNRRKIDSIADLAETVPGMAFTTTRTGNPVYTLRGIGFYEASLAAYPAVSVYVDQVPLSFPALSNHAQFDIQRVEVLKGPQGTLFGQNATGGAVNYVVARPSNTFEGGLELGYGNFNAWNLEGHISGPLTETLGARLAARVEQADGWQESLTRPGDKNGKVENYMVRLVTDYEPVDSVRLGLMLSAWKEKGETLAPQFVGFQPQFPIEYLPPAQTEAPFAEFDNESADWTPGLPRKDNEFFQSGLRAEFDIADDLTLVSLTSYIDYQQDLASDVDGLAGSAMDDFSNTGDVESFTQEIRLQNSATNSFRWMVGANYEKSEIFQNIKIRFPDSSTNQFLGTLGYPVVTDHNSSDQEMENWALFTSVEYDLSQALSIKAGVRYTDTYRRASICNADDEEPYYIGRFFYDVFAGGNYGEYPPDGCFAINNVSSGLIDPPPVGAPGKFQDELSESNMSWTVSPQWKINDDTLAYLTFAEGYKAGSFGNLAASTFVQYLPVTQESVLAYEAGVKATLADGRVQLNAATYYYDYTDKQLLSKVVDEVFGVIDVLQNIPKSSIFGIEAELKARPLDPLTVTFAVSYMDGQIDEFIGINNAGLAGDFSGTQLPATPEWQVAGDMEYTFRLKSYDAFVGASATYRSSTVSVVGGKETPPTYFGKATSPYTVDSYTLVNFRAGLSSSDGRWEAILWGKNVLDEYYWYDTIQSTADPVSRFAGMPATYGVSLAFNF